jgi:hypothetical protein
MPGWRPRVQRQEEDAAARDVEDAYRLMAARATRGTPIMLFLVQNGVLAVPQGADGGQLRRTADNASRQPMVWRRGP